MARRSYLQRIAAPLTPGEPVLFPVPTPPAEDARPAAPSRKPPSTPSRPAVAAPPPTAAAPADAAPAAAPPATVAPAAPAPVVRRKRATRGQIAAADQKPVPLAGIGAPQGDPDAAPGEAPQMPARHADTPEDWTAPAAVFAPPATKPVFFSATTAPGEKTPPASKPQAALSGTSPAPPGEPDLYEEPAPLTYSPSLVMPAVIPEKAGTGIHDFLSTTPALATSQSPSYLEPEPSPVPPQHATTWPAEHLLVPKPPSIHIGTIEIRATAPPVPAPAAPPPVQAAPAAAPRAAAAPPPRGYAWRFGLIQG